LDIDIPIRIPSEEIIYSLTELIPTKYKPTIIIADTEVKSIIQVSFPEPTKYSLSGLFKGDDISEFIEYFKEAYIDYGIARDTNKVTYFGRWYNPI
jgi:hypothetical protein